MKGTPRTAAEIVLHDRVAQLGCICCRMDGIETPLVSIHHCNGRTKPGCHEDVLPLCGAHHVKLDPATLAIHGNKRLWQAKYGKEIDLVEMVMREVGHTYIRPENRERPAPAPARRASKPRKKPTQPIARPVAKTPTRPKVPVQKRAPTASQLQMIADQKVKAKVAQSARKAEYELENKDKIDAMKDRVREAAKAQRQKIAAERKAQAKKQKAKLKRAA